VESALPALRDLAGLIDALTDAADREPSGGLSPAEGPGARSFNPAPYGAP